MLLLLLLPRHIETVAAAEGRCRGRDTLIALLVLLLMQDLHLLCVDLVGPATGWPAAAAAAADAACGCGGMLPKAHNGRRGGVVAPRGPGGGEGS
jgi:hypothetical protein